MLALDRLHHYTLLHRTSYKTVPSPHGVPPGVLAQSNLCGFKGHNFVAPCTDDFDKLVSCYNSFKNFRGDTCDRAPVSSDVSSERTRPVLCRFVFNNEPVVRNLFSILCIVGFEGTETPGNRVLNFLRHFLCDFFHL